MTEIASIPSGAKTTTINPLFAFRSNRLEAALVGGNDEGVQKEIDLEVGEVQSVFVEVGEALGVVPSYDHALIVATKKRMSKPIADFEPVLVSLHTRRRGPLAHPELRANFSQKEKAVTL